MGLRATRWKCESHRSAEPHGDWETSGQDRRRTQRPQRKVMAYLLSHGRQAGEKGASAGFDGDRTLEDRVREREHVYFDRC